MKRFDEICRDRLAEMEQRSEVTPRVAAHLRAEWERTAPRVKSYTYRSTVYGACVWSDSTKQHYTAQEYDAYLAALAGEPQEAAEEESER